MSLARLSWRGRDVDVEYGWLTPAGATAAATVGGSATSAATTDDAMPAQDTAPIVFLHEGLGSLSMWKAFPQRLCDALGRRGLVWSRPGYGRSTPRAPGERWDVDFLARQADEVLPALLDRLGVREPAWLFGHSDGASIALIRAARSPSTVAGAVVLAPHVFVEALSLRSIAAVRDRYLDTTPSDGRAGLRERLARFHDDVDSAFHGWNDIWLDPRFREWTIVDEIASIRCPLLVVQGQDDEYGTIAQVDAITRSVPGARAVMLSDCGHSPHVDQPEAVIAAAGSLPGLAAGPRPAVDHEARARR